MTSTASIKFRNKKACSAVGAALMAVGTMAAALAGSDGMSANALVFVAFVAFFIVFPTLTGLAIWIPGKLSEFLCTALGWAVDCAIGLSAVALLTISAFGWKRFFGFDSFGGPAIGSPAFGVGYLAFCAGAIMLAWCRTPLVSAPYEGHPIKDKVTVTGLVAFFLLVVPGILASVPERSLSEAAVTLSIPAEGASR